MKLPRIWFTEFWPVYKSGFFPRDCAQASLKGLASCIYRWDFRRSSRGHWCRGWSAAVSSCWNWGTRSTSRSDVVATYLSHRNVDWAFPILKLMDRLVAPVFKAAVSILFVDFLADFVLRSYLGDFYVYLSHPWHVDKQLDSTSLSGGIVIVAFTISGEEAAIIG